MATQPQSTSGKTTQVNLKINLIVVPDPEQYEALGNLEVERTQALNDITARLAIPLGTDDGSGGFWLPFSVPVVDGVTDTTVVMGEILTRLDAYAAMRSAAGISTFGLILADPPSKLALYYYKNAIETWCRYGIGLLRTDAQGRSIGTWTETAVLASGEHLVAEIRVGVEHEMIQGV